MFKKNLLCVLLLACTGLSLAGFDGQIDAILPELVSEASDLDVLYVGSGLPVEVDIKITLGQEDVAWIVKTFTEPLPYPVVGDSNIKDISIFLGALKLGKPITTLFLCPDDMDQSFAVQVFEKLAVEEQSFRTKTKVWGIWPEIPVHIREFVKACLSQKTQKSLADKISENKGKALAVASITAAGVVFVVSKLLSAGFDRRGLSGCLSLGLDPFRDLLSDFTEASRSARLRDLTPIDLIPDRFKKAVSAFEMQFLRSTAEDALDIQEAGDWVAFAVCDGHGGDEVAKALVNSRGRTHLLAKLLNIVSRGGVLNQEEVNRAYLEIDNLFSGYKGVGSTAVVCLINRLTSRGYFINLGDSRGVAIGNGKAIKATIDHSPEDPAETKRIKAQGGRVSFFGCHRVDGVLGVSRAFGDFGCKPLNRLSVRKYHVGIEPNIYEFALDGVDSIVLACDGVWDVIANDELNGLLAQAKTSKYCLAEFLCKSAGMRQSGDNISAMVINIPLLMSV